jgi:hypothetical protein
VHCGKELFLKNQDMFFVETGVAACLHVFWGVFALLKTVFASARDFENKRGAGEDFNCIKNFVRPRAAGLGCSIGHSTNAKRRKRQS